MKSTRTLITIVVLLAAASVCSQAQERAFGKANVPFAFNVQDVSLPAGTYTVSVLPPYNLIKVQGDEPGRVAMVLAIPTDKAGEPGQARMVFDHIGDRYFLTQVWDIGSGTRRDLLTGKLQKELAKNRTPTEATTIVANSAAVSH